MVSVSKYTYLPTVAVLALALVFAVPAVQHWRERPPAAPPRLLRLRASWTPPDGTTAGSGGEYVFGLALAADGRTLAYPALHAGVASLVRQDLRDGSTQPLGDTEGAAAPFWSPDGSRIGFFSNAHLNIVDIATGRASMLADAPSGRGGTMNQAGDVIFAAAGSSGLMRRSVGGTLSPFTTLGPLETAHQWPSFLPDGTHLIFQVVSADRARNGIWITTLNAPGERTRLVDTDAQALVVDSQVLYLADRSLMAQRLNATYRPEGRPSLIASPVGRGPLGQVLAAASRDVLITGEATSALRELQWRDRRGAPAGPASEPVDAWDLRIAPDGRRVAVTEVDRQIRTLDVFIRTGSQPAAQRLSLSTDADDSGVWSPDGLRIAWAGQRRKVMIRGAGAVLPEQTIAVFEEPVQVWDWSRDGRSLIISRRNATTGDDLWIQPPHEGDAAAPYSTAPFNQVFGVLSPDGTRLAYASDESGQFDVYVDSFPTPGARVRVTTAGGTEPRWSADGRELFFRRGSEIHAVALERFEVRSTTRLFDAGAPIRAYDVSRDGRFLINVPASASPQAPATLVMHWQP